MENKRKPIILVFTDSLGLPRDVPELVSYEETYIYKLRQHYLDYEIVSVSIGGADIITLQGQIFYYKNCKPKYVIVQAGIVDCAPRALTQVESAILNSNMLLRKVSKKVLKPFLPYLRKKRKKTTTPISVFSHYVELIYNSFSDTNFYWIKIIPAISGYEKLVPGIGMSIEKYNSILENIVGNKCIETSDFDHTNIMSDFHHLSTSGHKLIFDKIKLRIS